jgi:hypothetical protein
MSIRRKAKVCYQLDILEEVAREAGLEVRRNTDVRGWGGKSLGIADLVIRSGDSDDTFDIGFVQTEEGQEIIADTHGQFAEEKLKKLIPEYYKKKLKWSSYQIKDCRVKNKKLRVTISV